MSTTTQPPFDINAAFERWRKFERDGGGIAVEAMPTRPHLCIRTHYIYPNGETVDVFIDAKTGEMTDFGSAAHWLESAVIELPSAPPLDLMPDGVKADGFTLSLERGRLTSPYWSPSDARRLAHACMVLAWTAWSRHVQP